MPAYCTFKHGFIYFCQVRLQNKQPGTNNRIKKYIFFGKKYQNTPNKQALLDRSKPHIDVSGRSYKGEDFFQMDFGTQKSSYSNKS